MASALQLDNGTMTQKIFLTLLGIISLTISGTAVQGQSDARIVNAEIVDTSKADQATVSASIESAAERPTYERRHKTISGVGLAASYADRLTATFLDKDQPTVFITTEQQVPDGKITYNRPVPQYDIKTDYRNGELLRDPSDVPNRCLVIVKKLYE